MGEKGTPALLQSLRATVELRLTWTRPWSHTATNQHCSTGSYAPWL
jgi:hypothetical protein